MVCRSPQKPPLICTRSRSTGAGEFDFTIVTTNAPFRNNDAVSRRNQSIQDCAVWAQGCLHNFCTNAQVFTLPQVTYIAIMLNFECAEEDLHIACCVSDVENSDVVSICLFRLRHPDDGFVV